jgi:hypothetical protein
LSADTTTIKVIFLSILFVLFIFIWTFMFNKYFLIIM